MKWVVEFELKAAKAFEKLDKAVQRRIGAEIDRLAGLDNPKQYAKPLRGSLSDLCRFRVGDYRVICQIENAMLKILVVKVAHRRDVYK